MQIILENYQKDIELLRNKFLTCLKNYFKDKSLKVPFSEEDTENLHNIIITYFTLSKDDLRIIIHDDPQDQEYFFSILNPLMIDIKNEIKDILEITTNLKWENAVTLGCGPDGMKYSYYVSND